MTISELDNWLGETSPKGAFWSIDMHFMRMPTGSITIKWSMIWFSHQGSLAQSVEAKTIADLKAALIALNTLVSIGNLDKELDESSNLLGSSSVNGS